MNLDAVLPFALAVAVCTLAVITDVRSYRVYNTLTIPTFLGGLFFHFVDQGWTGLGMAFAGAMVAFAVLIIPYGMGALGAGDVKLVTALGAWLGFNQILHVALVACIATGIYAAAVLIFRGGLREAWFNLQLSWYRVISFASHLRDDGNEMVPIQEVLQQPDHRRQAIPFSVMVMLGVSVSFLMCWLAARN